MTTEVRLRASAICAALGHPTRVRIVEHLILSERSVNDIAARLNVQQSLASQHLAVLSRAGVIVAEARGASRVYRVRGPRIGRIMVLLEAFCTAHDLYGPEDGEDAPGEAELAAQ